jgi:hypothetical protein
VSDGKVLDAAECVRAVMTKVWRASALVTQFFKGDAVMAQLWLESPNPLLGNFSPLRMLELGRLEKLVEFIEQQLRENERPPEHPTVGVAGQPHPVALRELSPHEAAIVAVACPLCAAQIGELCKGEPGYVCIDRVLLVFP